MRAIVLEKFGGPDSLIYTDLPEPEPMPGHVVIEIKAFGLNHAEMHMRRGEWAEAAKVIGIECVGLVKACPGGEFPVGAKVAALMGVSGAPSMAAMPNTPECGQRTWRSSSAICPGLSWPPSPKPTRPRGPAYSAIWRSPADKRW